MTFDSIKNALIHSIQNGRASLSPSVLQDLNLGLLANLTTNGSLDLEEASVAASPKSVIIAGKSDLFGAGLAASALNVYEDQSQVGLIFSASFPDWRIPGASWLSLQELQLKVERPASGQTSFSNLSGFLKAASFSIPISLDLPTEGGGFHFNAFLDDYQLSDLDSVADLLGLSDFSFSLPSDLQAIADLSLSSISVQLDEHKRLTGVQARIKVAEEWEIVKAKAGLPKFALQNVCLEAASTKLNPNDEVFEKQFVLSASLQIGPVTAPFYLSVSSESQWYFGLASGEDVSLPSLGDLLDLVGGQGLKAQLPSQILQLGAVAVSDLGVAFSPKTKSIDTFSFGLKTIEALPLSSDRSFQLEEFYLQAEINDPFNRKPKVSGRLGGQTMIAETAVFLSADLDRELTFQGLIPKLELLKLAKAFMPDDPLPEELQFVLEDIHFTATPASGAIALGATSRLQWDKLPFDSALETALVFQFSRSSVGEGAGKKSEIDCSLQLSGNGPIQIADDFSLHTFDFLFSYLSGQEWRVGGAVDVELFGKQVSLEASYIQKQNAKIFTLHNQLNSAASLINIEDIASLEYQGIRLEIERLKKENNKAETNWAVAIQGSLAIAQVTNFAGQLELFKGEGGQKGLIFMPDKAHVSFPLPGTNTEMDLNFNGFLIKKISAKAGWQFSAGVSASFTPLPDYLDQILPNPIISTFSAGSQGIQLTVNRLTRPLTFDIPSIEINDLLIPLGTASIDVSNITVSFGDQIAIQAAFGVGLPSEINNIFGVENGRPKQEVFLTFEKDKPEATTVKTRFGVGTEGVELQVLSSPIKVIQLTEETDGVWFTADFGEVGAIRFRVPVFRFDLNKGSFEASGGVEVVRPLQIPLSLLKALLSANNFESVAQALPDVLPVKEINLVDENGSLKIDEWLALLGEHVEVPEFMKTIIETTDDIFEKLPQAFREYLNISLPDRLVFDISASPSGSFSFRLDTDGQPLKLVYVFVPAGPAPIPIFEGYKFNSVAFGVVSGGSLLQLEVDMIYDQFDLATLLLSMAIPESDAIPLPNSTQIHRRLIIERLFMLIVYQTTIPIPVPLFYDRLGVEYLGLEGVALQSHIEFPKPRLNAGALIKIFNQFKKFVSDRDFLLDPNIPLKGMDLKFSLTDNYLRLPEYLGHHLLGSTGTNFSISAYSSVAHLLNGLKTLSINYIIQAFPLEHRIGRQRAKLAFLSFEADWFITTPNEFRTIGLNRLIQSKEEVDKFLALLPALPVSGGSSKPKEEGLVTFLRGQAGVFDVAQLEVVFALAASGTKGFHTGVKIAGFISNLIELEIKGRIAVYGQNAEKQEFKGQGFELYGSYFLQIVNKKVLSGEIFLSNEVFSFSGMIDLFPDNSPLTVKGKVNGRFSRDQFFVSGNADANLAGLQLLKVALELSNTGVHFSAKWLGIQTRFDAYKEAGFLVLKASLNLNFDLRVNFESINKVLKGRSSQVAKGFIVDLSVRSGLEADFNQTGFKGKADAVFVLNDKRRVLGPFTVAVVPKSLEDLKKVVEEEIKKYGETYFEEKFDTVKKWLQGILDGVIDFSVAAFNAIKQWGQEAWKAVSEWTEDSWQALTQWSEHAWNATAQWSADAWKATAQWGAAAWEATTKWSADAWKATTQWSAAAWEATTKWGTDAWRATAQWGAAAWEATTKWGADVWKDSIRWTADVWDKTTGWTADQFKNALEWARKLLHGDVTFIPHGDVKLIPHGDVKLIPHGDVKLIPHGDVRAILHGDIPPVVVFGETITPHVDTPSAGHIDTPSTGHIDTPSTGHVDTPATGHIDTPPTAHIDTN